ncbi:hypothetical protein HYN48_13680 [Flavobacterium magnum]|uniref:Uncharacterized protein n=2 Tax=Flavobacterium magnum TaxID=2162713 RepID=A0A2S0RHN4_9FLAO|nr:hypothetical protein HYN48_13680 [Flavobacterium magnum]
MLGKMVVGTARIVGSKTQSEVFVNDQKQNNAKVFVSKSDFDGNESRDYLILYLRDLSMFNGFPVLVVDKQIKMVYYTNASLNDYNLIFGKLLQSESGANGLVAFNNQSKGLGFEPNLKINGNVITFEIPINDKVQKIKLNIA